jgi:hypothetical protein
VKRLRLKHDQFRTVTDAVQRQDHAKVTRVVAEILIALIPLSGVPGARTAVTTIAALVSLVGRRRCRCPETGSLPESPVSDPPKPYCADCGGRKRP